MKGNVYWIVGASSGIGEYLAYEVNCHIYLFTNLFITQYMLHI